jgi:hypothetical protein
VIPNPLGHGYLRAVTERDTWERGLTISDDGGFDDVLESFFRRATSTLSVLIFATNILMTFSASSRFLILEISAGLSTGQAHRPVLPESWRLGSSSNVLSTLVKGLTERAA